MQGIDKKVIRSYISEQTDSKDVAIHEIEPEYGGMVKIDMTVDGRRKQTSVDWRDLFIHACKMIHRLKKENGQSNE